MLDRVKDLWAHNRVALLAFVAVICLASFFGAKSVSQFIYWADPAHQDQPLSAWMTPRYVSQSYDLPPEVVQQAFGMPSEGPPRRVSLETIAAQSDLSIHQLQDRLDQTVASWRMAQGQRDE